MCEGGALHDWLVESVHRLHLTDSESVVDWLVDLRSVTDTECMCVLQGKSLTGDSTDVVCTPPKSVPDYVNTIQQCAQTVYSAFSKLLRRLESEQWKKFRKGFFRLVTKIDACLKSCHASLPTAPTNKFFQLEQQTTRIYRELAQYLDKFIEINGHRPNCGHINMQLSALRQTVSDIVNHTLTVLVQSLLDRIIPGVGDHTMLMALGQIVSIGVRHAEPLCQIIVNAGGVQQLVLLLYGADVRETDGNTHRLLSANVQAQALRTLATLCCVEDSFIQLQEAGGVDCLCDILCDGGRVAGDTLQMSERVRGEAAGVLAQITSPSFAGSKHVTTSLYSSFIDNLSDLVQALTTLCHEATNHEVFLLSCAALANMSLMDPMTCDLMMLNNTAKVLVDASSSHVTHSLFAKDQIVTVLASMSSIESCLKSLSIENGIAELLVQFLHERPRLGATPIELSACQRLQQKSATAITHLCQNEEMGLIFIELHCVPRLVELCTDRSQRSHSDDILLACLATLRKLYAVCGASHESLRTGDVRQLIEFSIVDSFLQHTTANESFI